MNSGTGRCSDSGERQPARPGVAARVVHSRRVHGPCGAIDKYITYLDGKGGGGGGVGTSSLSLEPTMTILFNALMDILLTPEVILSIDK